MYKEINKNSGLLFCDVHIVAVKTRCLGSSNPNYDTQETIYVTCPTENVEDVHL